MIPKQSSAEFGNQINARIGEIVSESTRFRSLDDPDVRELLVDISTLKKQDAASASVLEALIHAICGDREQAEYWLRNAARNNAERNQQDTAKLTMLIILGYSFEALSVLSECLRPDRGLINLFTSRPPPIGAFHMVHDAYDIAKQMNLSNTPVGRPFNPAIVEIMDAWGDTDEDYSRALDVAGQIVRERKMFLGRTPLSTTAVLETPDGSPGYVKMRFKIDTDVDTVIDMTCEYAEKLAQSGLKIPLSMLFEFDVEEK